MKNDKYKEPVAEGPASPLTAVLLALRQAPEPLSGEALAARLGLSRAAVWKRINRLKAQGYAIEGSPRRGYRLLAATDKLLPDEIKKLNEAKLNKVSPEYRKEVEAFFRALSENGNTPTPPAPKDDKK